jgi:XTP/dITP diphosphohydrolase
MKQIILASNNSGKIKEITLALSNCNFIFKSMLDYAVPSIAETGLTFVENALIKARHASAYTNLPAIADDSGLVVESLHGQPGIYSARYAGEHATNEENIAKLLLAMKDIPVQQRQAYFFCIMVFLRHPDDPTPIICQGTWHGEILLAPKGQQGFGYDPIFYVPTHHCSAAELSITEKNKVSHRGIALRELKKNLQFSLS